MRDDPDFRPVGTRFGAPQSIDLAQSKAAILGVLPESLYLACAALGLDNRPDD